LKIGYIHPSSKTYRMLKSILKNAWPHAVAILVFIALGLAYFSPVMEGKVLKTHDRTQFEGMAKETVDFRETEGEEPLWTNSMFGGMPTYMISTLHKSNLFKSIHKILTLGLPHPVSIVFLYMLGFYILMLTMRVDPWMAIVGSVAFAFSSYYFVILDAGHNSKALAIAYMAPVLAGIIITLRGKYLWGAIVTAFFLALEISVNHLQITYYLGMAVVIFLATHLVEAIREKTIPAYAKSLGFLAVAAVFAVLCNTSALWTSIEYSDYTTRGKTELTIKADGSSNEDIKTSGLDKEYVTAWSYGKEETLTFLIPNAKGGASQAIIGDDDYVKQIQRKKKDDYNLLVQNYQEYSQFGQSNTDPNAIRPVVAMKYWGNQSITSGPVYMGIIVFYLFLLGLFFKKGYLRWAILAIFILTVLLSWGKNLMGLTEFFLDYFPGYNKFRAVTIILSITSFVVPLLGILALKYVIDNRDWFNENWKKFGIVSGSFFLLMVLFALIPDSLLSFFTDNESAYYSQAMDNPEKADYANNMVDYLSEYRVSIFKADVMRSLLFLVLAIAVILLFIKRKINASILIPVLGLLILIDLWGVDKRYISNEDRSKDNKRWVTKKNAKTNLSPTKADLIILGAKQNEVSNFNSLLAERVEYYQEKNGKKKLKSSEQNTIALSVLNANSNYRVAHISNPVNESRTSYFHKSLGGYHGAKLKRYNELIEFHLMNDLQKAFAAIQSQQSIAALHNPPQPLHILNMLNTEFVVYDANNDQVPPFENPNAYGNAWFVENLKWVKNSDEEITELGNEDLSNTALIDERYSEVIKSDGGSGSISLESYKPNRLVYNSSSTTGGPVVFSEIFYDAGWQAYIDDEPVDHARANYVLRALDVPAGEHKVEFVFEPKSYSMGSTISLIFSAFIILAMFWQIFLFFKDETNEIEA